MPNLYTNRNVFHLSKSVLVLKAFRYEGILSSGGHLPLTRSMSPQLVGHGHLAVSHANHPQLLGNGHLPLTKSMSPPLVGNGSPSSEPCEPSSITREWVT